MDRTPQPAALAADQAAAGDALWFKDAVIYELHVKAPDGLLELLRAAWSDHADLLQTPVDGLAGLWNAMRAGPK
ncbi:MAG: hypothetical protein ABWZ41_01580 [Burkholderiales bacterium]